MAKRKATSQAAGALDADPGLIEIPAEPEPDNDNITINPETGAVEITNDDGSILIDPTGATLRADASEDESGDHFDNLAGKIDLLELSRIAEELLVAIDADKQDRSQWETMRAKAVELLGMKLDDPKSDVSRSAIGVSTSVVRDPILLEAVERFRATAYAELCPASGPVKVVNYADNKTGSNELAEALEKDLNYYLTTTASEYYPDTRYMLFWTGLASGTFKKVYRCPLRQRPVSEFVDGTDLIVPASATDLKNAPRVTHQVSMPKDILRAMQLEGVYRDVMLGEPIQSVLGPLKEKLASVDGKAPQSQRIEDQEFTVYECYCKLDIKGFEHKADGKVSGLPLPYRVTIEESTRQVLEVRRNWRIEDDDEIYRPPMIPFVLYPYSTGVSRIYGSGLGQMLGNMASALTALMRISIDGGMMANYPGLLKAKGTGRQMSNEIMVPPGGVAEIDTDGMPIQQVVMGMPFKDVSPAVIQLMEQTRAVAQRLGGTADMPVGEGKQDAPVGTTLALIEQATKIEGSVHKALHAAQSEEFRLLVELFREDPEALWRGNRRPAMGNAADDAARQARLDKFKRALDDCDIVPCADPNVPSDMHRNLMAMGLRQMAMGNPMYDMSKVDRHVVKQVFKMSDADFQSLLAPPQMGPPQIDPITQATLMLKAKEIGIKEQQVAMQAQNAEKDRQSKESIESLRIAAKHAADNKPGDPEMPDQVDPMAVAELQIKHRGLDIKEQEQHFKMHNAQAERENKLSVEALKVAQATAVHPLSDPLVDQQIEQMAPFLSPAKSNGGGLAAGGVVGEMPQPEAVSDWSVRLALEIARALQERRDQGGYVQ